MDLEALELASTRMSPSGVRILRILNRSAINESPLRFIELEVAVASNLDDGVKQAIILLKPAIQRPAAWELGKAKLLEDARTLPQMLDQFSRRENLSEHGIEQQAQDAQKAVAFWPSALFADAIDNRFIKNSYHNIYRLHNESPLQVIPMQTPYLILPTLIVELLV
ncbi:MAG: hypothetical protein A3K16_03560 [Omnitrophica bacterium RIFCSPLOWO2_01_FULL_45_24]|nr:MAG: hypothetical protein A3K16_03560 [Omnitrophica bacterium RIFCSPLOWO2_01_FULL_45_24]